MRFCSLFLSPFLPLTRWVPVVFVMCRFMFWVTLKFYKIKIIGNLVQVMKRTKVLENTMDKMSSKWKVRDQVWSSATRMELIKEFLCKYILNQTNITCIIWSFCSFISHDSVQFKHIVLGNNNTFGNLV